MPTFLDGQPQDNQFNEIEDNFKEYAKEHATLSVGFKRQVTLDQYYGIKFRDKPKRYYRNNSELERGEGKMEIPYFDGSSRVTMQAWV
jgi:hypothetical protein